MRRFQMGLWGLMVMTLICAPAQSTWAAAATQVPDPGLLLQANPNASGTKIFTKLTIFYTLSAVQAGCPGSPIEPTVDMHISIHAWQGNSNNGHTAGVQVFNKCYLTFNGSGHQREVVSTLIHDVLLPKFGFTTFELKDVDNLVQDENGTGVPSNPFFMMADLTLAAR